MKKIVILLSCFLLVGCTTNLSSNLSIDELINNVVSFNTNKSNTNGLGFKYYKPRDFSLLEDDNTNHVLLGIIIKGKMIM